MSVVREHICEEIPHLRRYALFLSRDAATAEDLVQDCVLTAIARAEQYRSEFALRPWLFAILRNTFFNQLRRGKHQPLVDEETARDHGPVISGNQEASVQLGELQSALDRLSPEHRDIILKVAVEGFTYEEAAQTLGVPVGTVRSRLARARVALQCELGHEAGAFNDEGRSKARRRNQEGVHSAGTADDRRYSGLH